ncbi:hypothetical protein TWF696_008702 [Orbilia brochopaga]|uniref:ATP-dependent RNA helicase n=1 Tax=Orbilia brochopaga TaxID=3140254 RepID=A0AAV9UK24_9PEZI
MLRLKGRLLGKQATSPTSYICQRCLHSTRWASPSAYPSKPTSCRSYHATQASLARMGMQQVPRATSRYRIDHGDGNAEPYRPKKPYGRTRKFRRFQDESPGDGEDASRDFDPSRYEVNQPGRIVEAPDLQTIMANSQASDFARQLHKLRREELERRDPAMQILARLQTPNTFEESSIRPVMKKALAKAFPNVTALSPTQKNLLLLLQEGYSLCATGPPGSGKSFTIAVWLLQMMRSIKSTIMPNGSFRKTPITTSILFVPHVDLLHQYMRLLETLYDAFGEPGRTLPPKEAVFQGFSRYGQEFAELESEQIRTLAKHPSPHIIVTTPPRLLDILNDPDSKSLLDLTSLKVIVADEVDAMISQRPTPKRLDDMTTTWKKRQEMRWKKSSPMETCVDFILARREMRASQRGESPDPVQFCCISPNLSPVLKSKLVHTKKWVGYSEKKVKANVLVNLGIQDFSKMFDHDKIAPIVQLPARIKHYALSVDITSGMMRDIPRYSEDALIRSKDEQAEIQKYVGILKSHKDPRVEAMSQDALAVEAAQEKGLTEEEGSLDKYNYDVKIEGHPEFQIRDIMTSLPNDFRHTGIPRNVAVEVIDVLLKRDNYPERVLMYVSPIASRASFIEALTEAGFNAQHVRMETCEQHGIPIGRSDIPAPPLPEEPETRIRTKADTTIWVASNVSLRGIDLPHFTHAYIMVPTTGYQRYAQMAGRIARYPFTKRMGPLPEPEGQVTTIFLEEPAGEHELAPLVDGVVQVDSPVEGLAWRRIHRMYGVCGAKVDKYFPVDEPNGIMLSSPKKLNTKFPGMDDDLPWEHEVEKPESEQASAGFKFEEPQTYMDVPEEIDSVLSGEEAIKSRSMEGGSTRDSITESEGSNTAKYSAEYSETTDSSATGSDVSVELTDSSELLEVLGSKEDSEAAGEAVQAPENDIASEPIVQSTAEPSDSSTADEQTAQKEETSSDMTEDDSDNHESSAPYKPVELQDGPHFAPEDSNESPTESELTDSTANETSPDTEDSQSLAEIPLEVAEGVTEEEAKEFQEAQDEIFSAFLELNVLQEQIRKAKEEGAVADENALSEQGSDAPRDNGEVADVGSDGAQDDSSLTAKSDDEKA